MVIEKTGRYEIMGITSHIPRGGRIVIFAKGDGGVYAHPNDMPTVNVPSEKVCDNSILKREVLFWLNKNVGVQNPGVISVWDFISHGTETAQFRFVSPDSAALFKLFWS